MGWDERGWDWFGVGVLEREGGGGLCRGLRRCGWGGRLCRGLRRCGWGGGCGGKEGPGWVEG